MKLLIHPFTVCTALFLVFLAYYTWAALKLPTLFNLDNQYNHAATRYIAQHLKIPAHIV